MIAARSRNRRAPNHLRQIVGVVTIAAVAIMVYVATIAQNGLPWQSRYRVTVELSNAERLVSTDQVEIGGVVVGQVSSVTAIPPTAGRQAYVRIGLALNPSVAGLPVDTSVKVLSSSVLGATYVALTPGASPRKVPPGGALPLANARSTVQLTDLFDIFNRATTRDVQQTLGELSAGFAGRGTTLNATLASLKELLAPLTSVSGVLAARTTRLAGFLHVYSSFAGALAPVADTLGGLVSDGSRTFAAIAGVRPALASTIEVMPGAETAATRALTFLHPSLEGLARLAVDLRAGAAALPGTLGQINTTLVAGVPPARQLPAFADRLRSTLATLESVTRRRPTDRAVVKLTDVVQAADPTLALLTPAQVYCNVIPPMFLNFASFVLGFGVGQGPSIPMFSFTNLGASGELLQQGRPSSNVDINYVPTENASECASGNEPANGVTQRFNNPPGQLGHAHPVTAPPPASWAFAGKAGLLTPPQGWQP